MTDVEKELADALITQELGENWRALTLALVHTTWEDNNNYVFSYLCTACSAVGLWNKAAGGYIIMSSSMPEYYLGQVVILE